LKTPSEDLPCDTIHDGTFHAQEKQLLLECLLQDPKHAWLHYLDGREALPVGVLLHLSKLSLTGEEFSQSTRRKA
jgi:hypothetical protein